MQILTDLGRAHWEGAILHNELIVKGVAYPEGLHYNGLLCNIAWGWFWAFERWVAAYCFFCLTGISILTEGKKTMCCWSVGKSPKPQERWGALDGAGAKRSAIAFLLFFNSY